MKLSMLEIARLAFHSGSFTIKAPGGKTPLATATAIAWAESKGDTNAKHTNKDGSIDRGLWQINSMAHTEVPDEQAYDPQGAAIAASNIYYGAAGSGGSFKAWATYNSGAYLAYMPAAIVAANLAYKEWTAKPNGKKLGPGHYYPHDPIFGNDNAYTDSGNPNGPDYTGTVPGVNGFPFVNIDAAIKGLNPFDLLKALYEFFFHRNGAVRVIEVILAVVLFYLALKIFIKELT